MARRVNSNFRRRETIQTYSRETEGKKIRFHGEATKEIGHNGRSYYSCPNEPKSKPNYEQVKKNPLQSNTKEQSTRTHNNKKSAWKSMT